MNYNSNCYYIPRRGLIYAVEDYVEVKNIRKRQSERLRSLALDDARRFVSKGRLTERFKPYVLPFLKIGDFKNTK